MDDDTLAAVVRLVEEHGHELKAITGLPRAGRIRADHPTPYLSMECTFQSNEHLTGGVTHDYRMLTLTVRGTKTVVVSALSLIAGLFDETLGQPNYPKLEYPSGARFIRMWPESHGKLQQDEQTNDGDDIWQGIWDATVWSIRT